MQYRGIVGNEALLSDGIFNFAVSQKPDARPGFTSFIVENDFSLPVSEELSRELKPGAWALLESESERVIVFPNKIFRFYPTDEAKQQKALEYAASLGIPAAELHL